MTREICLNWNNHSSILNSFKNFLSTEEMVDVTLACEGKSLKAHKLILSACSPFFQSLLSENPCKHPIVILTDVKYKELQAVIDFMYDGEINVSEEHLAPLIKVAEALKVKVLGDVTIGDESEFHIGDESECHVGDESESNSSNESKPLPGAVSGVQSGDESELHSGVPVSRVQSDDESESQSRAVSRIQSEDESESQSSTVSKIQTDDELECSSVSAFTHMPAALTVTYSPRRGRPRKRSRSCPSDSGASEPDPGTEVSFGDMELSPPNLNDSPVSIKPQRTTSPRKSPKKQPVEENFATESPEVTMPILEEQMLIDKEVSIIFQY